MGNVGGRSSSSDSNRAVPRDKESMLTRPSSIEQGSRRAILAKITSSWVPKTGRKKSARRHVKQEDVGVEANNSNVTNLMGGKPDYYGVNVAREKVNNTNSSVPTISFSLDQQSLRQKSKIGETKPSSEQLQLLREELAKTHVRLHHYQQQREKNERALCEITPQIAWVTDSPLPNKTRKGLQVDALRAELEKAKRELCVTEASLRKKRLENLSSLPVPAPNKLHTHAPPVADV